MTHHRSKDYFVAPTTLVDGWMDLDIGSQEVRIHSFIQEIEGWESSNGSILNGCQILFGLVVFDRKMRKDNRHFASQTKPKPKSVKNIVFCVWNKSNGFNVR